MEKRQILIANSKDQSRYRIVTDATTLGELQDAIARNEEVYKMIDQSWVNNPSPINISGLTFTEGITKTQLISRESALPTNVQFKGQVTNDLVMLLTNTNKQIRSGANYPTDRKLFGAYIKDNNLGEAIKQQFGDNWTRVSTDKLISFFASAAEKPSNSNKILSKVREELNDQEKIKEAVSTPTQETEVPSASPEDNPLPDVKKAPHAATVEWFYTGLKQMASDHLLSAEDIVVIANLTTELAHRLIESKPQITTDDIDEMVHSIK